MTYKFSLNKKVIGLFFDQQEKRAVVVSVGGKEKPCRIDRLPSTSGRLPICWPVMISSNSPSSPCISNPPQTILIYTPQTDQVRQRIDSVIDQCRSISCDAYDIESLVKALDEELANQQGTDLIFNLTGGTKAMVLATNQVAMKRGAPVVYLESERTQNVLYEYRYDNQQTLRLQGKTTLPKLINIKQFLDAHIGKGQWQEAGPSKDIGGAFEQTVADAIRARLSQAEVKQGIKFLGSNGRPQVDLDIVVRCGNQFARIECKSQGKTTTLDAAKQLNLVSELLGVYTRKFIALSNEPKS
jgi:hypothetical protein